MSSLRLLLVVLSLFTLFGSLGCESSGDIDDDDDDSSSDDDDAGDDDSGDDDTDPVDPRPPGEVQISLAPTNPTTLDNLSYSLIVPAADPDGDLAGYHATWLQNGAPRTDLANSTIVGAAETTRDDTWEVYVAAYDSTGLEGPTASASVVVVNSPPTATAGLSPESPKTTDDLALALTTSDADDDTVTSAITWLVDTNPSAAHSGFNTIPAADTARGQTWVARVTPNDGDDDGYAVEDSVVIGNTLPGVEEAVVSPADPVEGQTVVVAVTAELDPDGDTVALSYSWYVGGSLVAGQGSASLSSDYFDKGQDIYVVVTPNDGVGDGASLQSNTVTGANTLPQITSVSVDPTSGTEETPFACVATGWSDPDPSDSESYTYQWLVDSSNSATTATLTGSSFNKANALQCQATPVDSDGSGTTVLSGNTVTVDNTTPLAVSVTIQPASPMEGDPVTASPSGWSDPDTNDTEGYQYAWYVEALPVSTSESVDGGLFDAGDDIYLVLTPWDGETLGAPLTSNTVEAINTPPEVASVSISPTTAYTETDLTAVPSGWVDPDPGDTEGYVYAWSVDGSPAGGDSSTLDHPLFVKGQPVTVTITPDDGADQGTPQPSDVLTISNSSPSAPEVAIDPEFATYDQDLECSIAVGGESVDPDTTDSLTYSFAWAEGSQAPAYSSTGESESSTLQLPAAATAIGDAWACEVTATDDDSVPATSDPGTATASFGCFDGTDTSLKFWLDARDYSLSDGASMAGVLSDKSSYGHTMTTTATYEATGFGGLPSIRHNFNRTSLDSPFSTANDTYMFLAIEILSTPESWASILEHHHRDNGLALEHCSACGGSIYHWQTNNDNTGVAIELNYAERYLMFAKLENGNERTWEVWKDDGSGTLVLHGSASSSNGTVVIGSDRFWLGRGSGSSENENANFRLAEMAYFQGSLPVSVTDTLSCMHERWWN